MIYGSFIEVCQCEYVSFSMKNIFQLWSYLKEKFSTSVQGVNMGVSCFYSTIFYVMILKCSRTVAACYRLWCSLLSLTLMSAMAWQNTHISASHSVCTVHCVPVSLTWHSVDFGASLWKSKLYHNMNWSLIITISFPTCGRHVKCRLCSAVCDNCVHRQWTYCISNKLIHCFKFNKWNRHFNYTLILTLLGRSYIMSESDIWLWNSSRNETAGMNICFPVRNEGFVCHVCHLNPKLTRSKFLANPLFSS